MKINSSLLDFKNYNLQCDINTMRKNKWLVSLADSQALRTIRKIRYSRDPDVTRYDPEVLNDLKINKKRICRHKYSNESYEALKNINQAIDEMLYMPEYIIITIDKKKHYSNIIKNGLLINGYNYVRLLCGAGHARNNTVVFIRQDFEQEVKEHLRNGCRDVKITENKYNAYFALSSTATYRIDDEQDRDITPKALLVDDCEITMTKKVDWVEKVEEFDPELPIALQNKYKINTQEKELLFNLFDGGGLIDISAARKWAEKLELNYVPSVFILRNIFVKGCLFVVDFKKFAKEVAGKTIVTDLYGNEQNVLEKDIILTKSMFKLWNAYDSMEQYQECCEKYGNYWGISRVSPKNDDDYVTTNYQFLQVLDMKQDDVEKICNTTLHWLKGVSGLDRVYSMLFLMGNLANGDDPELIYSSISDNIVKALAINHNMIKDDYIRQKLISAINKKIKESYIGKLLVRGCFSTMIPDPYAMMEWVFGLPVKGLLKEYEHYSQYWNKRCSKEVVGCRSPLTWRSEINKLNLVKNEQTEEWYQYLNSGIVYNVFGNDCMLHADSDYDGDIVFTTDDETFLNCKFYDEFNNLPITYEKQTVAKKIVKEKHLYRADLKSFDTKIGQITNYSTSFYDLLYKFKDDYSEYGRKCYNEILERLKLTRFAQGNEIDAAKGIKTDPYPSHWINKQFINPDDSEKLKEYKSFLNDICANRKPIFFKHRYSASKNDDKIFQSSIELFSMLECGKSIKELSKDNQNEQELLNSYENKSVLIDYNSPMNKVYHYMEDNLSCLKKQSTLVNLDVSKLLKTNKEPLDNFDKINIIKNLADDYFSEKSKFKKGINKDYVNIDQYAKILKDRAIEYFDNEEELTNYVVEVCYIQRYHQSKSFAWCVFGDFLIRNLMRNSSQPITIPVADKNGEYNYLFNRYTLKDVYIDRSDL
jgi:hypothetical protein